MKTSMKWEQRILKCIPLSYSLTHVNSFLSDHAVVLDSQQC